jgi:hypothetical protein
VDAATDHTSAGSNAFESQWYQSAVGREDQRRIERARRWLRRARELYGTAGESSPDAEASRKKKAVGSQYRSAAESLSFSLRSFDQSTVNGRSNPDEESVSY